MSCVWWKLQVPVRGMPFCKTGVAAGWLCWAACAALTEWAGVVAPAVCQGDKHSRLPSTLMVTAERPRASKPSPCGPKGLRWAG